MDGNTSSSLILLTYKNKALLMYKQKNSLDDGRDAWSFIGSAKNANEPDETALKRNIEQEMGIEASVMLNMYPSPAITQVLPMTT